MLRIALENAEKEYNSKFKKLTENERIAHDLYNSIIVCIYEGKFSKLSGPYGSLLDILDSTIYNKNRFASFIDYLLTSKLIFILDNNDPITYVFDYEAYKNSNHYLSFIEILKEYVNFKLDYNHDKKYKSDSDGDDEISEGDSI